MKVDLPEDFKPTQIQAYIKKGEIPELMYWVWDTDTSPAKKYTEASAQETLDWVSNLHGHANLAEPEMYTLLAVKATALDLAIGHKIAVWAELLGGSELHKDEFFARDRKAQEIDKLSDRKGKKR